MPSLRSVTFAAAVGALLAPPAMALDYQVHGSLAQGFILSEGNDFYGPSTDGSFQYYEAALNGVVKPMSQLLLSAQVIARDAGATDDGMPRLDYAFLDYEYVSGSTGDAGVRLGRVKNSYGLYNDSRDVIFTRPGVLMPSTYFESSGARAMLFSSDGLQPYGALTLGGHYLSVLGTYAPDATLDHRQAERLGLEGKVDLEDFYMGRVQDEWDGWTGALSYLHGVLEFEFPPGTLDSIDFQVYVLSARYNAARFSVTSEYSLTDTAGTFGPLPFHGTSDAAYVQGDYFLTPEWSLMARWDSSFVNRNDRSGDECQVNFAPADRHNCFAHDLTLGASWKSASHWGVWGEYHRVDGLATASQRDNGFMASDTHWSMLVLMGAYRF
jgi:hypothetical protein